MKFLAIFFSLFALAASQYYYQAAPRVVETPFVNTYNSYVPYAAAASYGYAYPSAAAAAAYPVYGAYAYGSNKGPEQPIPASAKLTNNRALRF